MVGIPASLVYTRCSRPLLTHVEHIHAEDADAETAVRLAKRMIRDGRMPTPEEATQQLRHQTAGNWERVKENPARVVPRRYRMSLAERK
jgi:hypothetical protein